MRSVSALEVEAFEMLGPYALVGRLGEGGMGEVWLGARPDARPGAIASERFCVVKRIRPEYFGRDDVLARFLEESRLTLRLRHANVAVTLDAGTDAQDAYLVMELIDGCNLAELLQRGGALSVPLALWIVAEALDGVDYVHELVDFDTGEPLRVVHRDLSLKNLMVATSGDVKIIDFGVAVHADRPELTAQSSATGVVGNARYLAPEVVRTGRLGVETDLWALGVVLLELVTGRRLWGDLSNDDVLRALIRRGPPPLRLEGVPPDVARIIEAALQPDPEKRYRSARGMRGAIAALLRRRGVVTQRADAAALVQSRAADLVAENQRLLAEAVRLFNERATPETTDKNPVATKTTQLTGRRTPTFVGQLRDAAQALLPTAADPPVHEMDALAQLRADASFDVPPSGGVFKTGPVAPVKLPTGPRRRG